ncbi:hypothetical protein K1T71_006184 [Dendrolimus kikuchii]|uniref:Uncharacterized protein n=1 Tax=Dendrolimus kikuchii TaxID=765133 RepID=A0ACC1D3D9_9NEOP|nr:hypothetical protein K1T71_006184 [Dendrolimus kikuchii]
MGDINQISFIDRNDLFPMLYHRPTSSAKITREQLCTHRNPLDVAYAMSDVYSVKRKRLTALKKAGVEYTDGAN